MGWNDRVSFAPQRGSWSESATDYGAPGTIGAMVAERQRQSDLDAAQARATDLADDEERRKRRLMMLEADLQRRNQAERAIPEQVRGAEAMGTPLTEWTGGGPTFRGEDAASLGDNREIVIEGAGGEDPFSRAPMQRVPTQAGLSALRKGSGSGTLSLDEYAARKNLDADASIRAAQARAEATGSNIQLRGDQEFERSGATSAAKMADDDLFMRRRAFEDKNKRSWTEDEEAAETAAALERAANRIRQARAILRSPGAPGGGGQAAPPAGGTAERAPRGGFVSHTSERRLGAAHEVGTDALIRTTKGPKGETLEIRRGGDGKPYLINPATGKKVTAN